MNNVYILGGAPRTAKTTIMLKLIAEKNIQFVAADAVEHGLRNVLTGKPHQMLSGIQITGSAEHKTSFTDIGKRKIFSNKGTESEFTLQAVTGMIDYYNRNNESVAFEGAVFTPDWTACLKRKGFNVRAAFVGYTSPVHADNIIYHAKENIHDWINEWLENKEGDETEIREWVTKQSKKCETLKNDAKQYGFPFFDISTMPFPEYISSVKNYFLTVK